MTVRIMDLAAISTLTSQSILEISSGGQSFKVTLGQLQTFIGSNQESHVTVDAGATAEIQVDQSNNVTQYLVNLSQATTALSILGSVITGSVWKFDLLFVQTTGNNLLTWPENIKFSGGNTPVLSYSQGNIDIVTIENDPSVSNGWFGFYKGTWL